MTAARWSEYRLRRRVHFYELDSAGIVHFSWFFRYMEDAEHAMWREAGLSIAPPGRAYAFPRVSATCDYHRPLRFEDEFDIVIRIAAIAEKTIKYDITMLRGDTRIATGTLTIACVTKLDDGTLKAIPIPADIVARFEVAASA